MERDYLWTKAAESFPSVIVEEWGKGSNWQRSARLGHRVVESHYSDFYLDSAKWSPAQMWKDLYISTQGGDGHVNANASERALLLGGETAMWSDQYVPPKTTNVVCMFQSPSFDSNFSTSTSSMIWPRAAVAAGSFYRFDAALSNSSDAFAGLLQDINRRLTAEAWSSAAALRHHTRVAPKLPGAERTIARSLGPLMVI